MPRWDCVHLAAIADLSPWVENQGGPEVCGYVVLPSLSLSHTHTHTHTQRPGLSQCWATAQLITKQR